MSSMFKKIALIVALVGSTASASAATEPLTTLDLSSLGSLGFNFNNGTLTNAPSVWDGVLTGGSLSTAPLQDFYFSPIWLNPTIDLVGGTLTFSPNLWTLVGGDLTGGVDTLPQIPTNPNAGFPLLWISDDLTFKPIDFANLTSGLTLSPAATAAVPEPANIALFGLGLMGIVAVARRRRQARWASEESASLRPRVLVRTT